MPAIFRKNIYSAFLVALRVRKRKEVQINHILRNMIKKYIT